MAIVRGFGGISGDGGGGGVVGDKIKQTRNDGDIIMRNGNNSVEAGQSGEEEKPRPRAAGARLRCASPLRRLASCALLSYAAMAEAYRTVK
jgi:hypothetical protein